MNGIILHSIAHNRLDSKSIKRGDFVRLLNQRGAFDKEGQRFTCKIYLVEEVALEFKTRTRNIIYLKS